MPTIDRPQPPVGGSQSSSREHMQFGGGCSAMMSAEQRLAGGKGLHDGLGIWPAQCRLTAGSRQRRWRRQLRPTHRGGEPAAPHLLQLAAGCGIAAEGACNNVTQGAVAAGVTCASELTTDGKSDYAQTVGADQGRPAANRRWKRFGWGCMAQAAGAAHMHSLAAADGSGLLAQLRSWLPCPCRRRRPGAACLSVPPASSSTASLPCTPPLRSAPPPGPPSSLLLLVLCWALGEAASPRGVSGCMPQAGGAGADASGACAAGQEGQEEERWRLGEG